MVTAAEIRDSGEALMAWLRSRDKSDQDLLAIRCILRSLPAVCRDLSGAESASDKNATLYLGSLLRSAWRIGRHDSTDLLPFLNEDSVNRLSPYGRDAVHSAVGMFYAERSDILPAVRSVLSAASAGYLPYRLAGHDAVAIEGNENPLFSPLWHGEPVPEKRSGLPEELRARGGGWVFWADWYEGYLTGNPLDIDLLEKVALIPSEDWDKGDDHVNGIIAAIRQDHAIARTPNGEVIAVNPDTGKLRIVVDTALPGDLDTYARRKIRAAVDVFSLVHNQYSALAPDLHRLRQAADDPEYTPVELFDECAAASRRLGSRIRNGEVPEAEKAALIADYGHRIREAGADILANDPKTQEVLTARARIVGTDSLVTDAEAVRAGVDLLLPVTEGLLARRLPEDAAVATDPSADPEDRKVAGVKLASRYLRSAAAQVSLAGRAVVGTAKTLEAISVIRSSPVFQAALQAVYRYLGF